METIYCDESGYTGNNLLEANQPFFVYSGVKLDENDVNKAIALIHDNYPVQGEIKGGSGREYKCNFGGHK